MVVVHVRHAGCGGEVHQHAGAGAEWCAPEHHHGAEWYGAERAEVQTRASAGTRCNFQESAADVRNSRVCPPFVHKAS